MEKIHKTEHWETAEWKKLEKEDTCGMFLREAENDAPKKRMKNAQIKSLKTYKCFCPTVAVKVGNDAIPRL